MPSCELQDHVLDPGPVNVEDDLSARTPFPGLDTRAQRRVCAQNVCHVRPPDLVRVGGTSDYRFDQASQVLFIA